MVTVLQLEFKVHVFGHRLCWRLTSVGGFFNRPRLKENKSMWSVVYFTAHSFLSVFLFSCLFGLFKNHPCWMAEKSLCGLNNQIAKEVTSIIVLILLCFSFVAFLFPHFKLASFMFLSAVHLATVGFHIYGCAVKAVFLL